MELHSEASFQLRHAAEQYAQAQIEDYEPQAWQFCGKSQLWFIPGATDVIVNTPARGPVKATTRIATLSLCLVASNHLAWHCSDMGLAKAAHGWTAHYHQAKDVLWGNQNLLDLSKDELDSLWEITD